MIPSPGRIVLVNISDEPGFPVLRPAIIVRVWDEYCVNARILLDGGNDDRHRVALGLSADHPDWLTSISRANAGDGSIGFRQWAWPPRV